MQKILLTLLFLTSALSAKERPEVTGTMRDVFNALMNIQPFIVNGERFKAPEHKKEITRDLKTMSSLKHVFPKKMVEEEPGIVGIAELFVDYMKDTEKRYHEGNFEYARHRLATVTGFCFSCHTRVSTSRNFEDFQKRIEGGKYSPYEKAEMYASTRQWDKALSSYDSVLTTKPKDELGVIKYTRGLRHALSISVRVKKDPNETVNLLNKVAKQDDLAEFVRRFVSHWQKDARYWASNPDPKEMTGEQKVERARELIDRAAKLQAFPADENGDVSYLRASNLLHEALDNAPKGKFRGEALYLLGMCYYALQDPTLWDLDKIYFEACIRENAHSDLSKKCFHKYAEKIYLGYSGSAGTFIPDDEAKRMAQLRKLAE